jgi:uncharacterized protein (DUF58 family)
MDTSSLMAKVKKIELKMKGLNTQLFSGEYHTAFKGRGMSFSEVREYAYGDDVRNIDWNVTARTQDLYVKIFEEERELTVMLLIDVSGSTLFGTGNKSKKDTIIEMAAVLGFSALNNNDKVGAILFSDKVEAYLPPKKGRQNILMLIRDLLVIEPQSKKTNLSVALNYLNNVQKKRCITFLISDMMDNDYEKSIKLTARKHDLIGVNIYDDSEVNLSAELGMILARDQETGELFFVDAGSNSYRKTYLNEKLKMIKSTEELFRKSGALCKALSTNDDYIKVLIEVLRNRR